VKVPLRGIDKRLFASNEWALNQCHKVDRYAARDIMALVFRDTVSYKPMVAYSTFVCRWKWDSRTSRMCIIIL